MQEQGPAAAEQLGLSFEDFLTMMQAPSAIKRMNTVEDGHSLLSSSLQRLEQELRGSLISIDGGQSPYKGENYGENWMEKSLLSQQAQEVWVEQLPRLTSLREQKSSSAGDPKEKARSA
ncbi:MAG: hypothetical protein CM15mP49_33240 [Actinomycetota bacterium]|nr:MAG: hypothetical protein CM15mP49_33240 [Actinomycetota bacterium]